MALDNQGKIRLLKLKKERLLLEENQDTPSVLLDSTPEVSLTESAIRGAGQAASFGFQDEIAGGLESALDKLSGSDESLSDLYTKRRDESRLLNDTAYKVNPKAYTSGEIGGNIATAFIPGLNVVKGASLAKIAGKAAVQGFLSGAGSSNSELTDGKFYEDAAVGGTVGAVLGVAGKRVGDYSQRFLDGNYLSKKANIQSAKALGLERATRKKLGEEKVQEIGRQALDENIFDIGSGAEEMFTRNKSFLERNQDARNSVYNLIDSHDIKPFDPTLLASEVEKKLGNFNKLAPVNSSKAAKLRDGISSIKVESLSPSEMQSAQRLMQSDSMSLDEAMEFIEAERPYGQKALNTSMQSGQRIVKSLQDNSKFTTLKPSPSDELMADMSMMSRERLNQSAEVAGDILKRKEKALARELNNPNTSPQRSKEIMNEVLEIQMVADKVSSRSRMQTGSPEASVKDIGQGVRDINKSTSTALDTNLLLDNKVAREANKQFHLTDVISLSGQNPMLYFPKKVWEEYGNKTLALGMDRLDKHLIQNPQKLGKYQNVLQQAAQKGSTSLGIANFILMNKDPEYRKTIKSISDNNEEE